MASNTTDRPALVVVGLMSIPVGVGIPWAAWAASSATSDHLIAAAFMALWLVIALPVAVLVGRGTARHTSGLDEEER